MVLNKEKFEIFLKVARVLNKQLGVTPILYGSLGLNRVIGEFKKANDIDIIVPDKFLAEKWLRLVQVMEKLHFKLINEKEHKFRGNGEMVAFDPEKVINVSLGKLKVSKVNNIRFKEFSAKNYLNFYKFIIKKKGRGAEKIVEDNKKINLIEKFLKNR